MARAIVLSCTLFILSFSLHAQIAFGAKAGMNLANWTTEGHNTITAFQGGLVAQFPLGENFSVQTELIYDGKGTDLSNFIPNNSMRFTMKYLTLNALVGYKVRGITFMLGPYVSDSLSARFDFNNMEVDFPDGLIPFEKWDWGLTAGATLDITAGFGFEVLYYFGFPDIVHIPFGDSNGNLIANLDEGMNRVLQLSAYYKWNSE